jgi:hypothetical protein
MSQPDRITIPPPDEIKADIVATRERLRALRRLYALSRAASDVAAASRSVRDCRESAGGKEARRA